MNVQLLRSRLEIDITEWLKTGSFKLGKLDKNTAIAGKPLKVTVALLIKGGRHLLYLKVRHIADTTAQRALVAAGSAKLKTLNHPAMRKNLAGDTDNLAETNIFCKNADDVSTAGNPYMCFVFLCL